MGRSIRALAGSTRRSFLTKPDTILDYAPIKPGRKLPWRRWLILLLLAAGIAFVYWWYADWWAYVHEGGGVEPWPKFIMPLWWQIGESAVVGIVAAGAIELTYRFLCWLERKL